MADSARPDKNNRVSAAEFARNLAYWQEQAIERPITVTYHGRDRLVVAPISLLREHESRNAEQSAEPGDLVLLREHIPEAYIAWDRELRCRDVNRAAEHYMGAPRSELIGRSFIEIFKTDMSPALADIVRRAMNGEELTTEYESSIFEGRRLLVHAFPSRDGGAAIFSNITEQAHLKRRVARKESMIAAMEANGSVAAMHLDGFGRTTDCSESLLQWSGFTTDELTGRPLSDFLLRTYRHRFRDLVIAALEQRTSQTLDAVLVRKDLTETQLHLAIAPRLEGYAAVGATVVATIGWVRA